MRMLLVLVVFVAACGERVDDTAPAAPAPAVPASAELMAPRPEASPPTVFPRPTNGPPPPAPVHAGFSLPMRLVGTEPFWGGRIAADAITVSGMDRPDMTFPYTQPVVTGAGARWRTQSIGAFPLEVTIVRDPCSNGMSDKRYPFQATVVLGTETLKGCAIREAEFGGER
jgi:uncharacterized membrane protein